MSLILVSCRFPDTDKSTAPVDKFTNGCGNNCILPDCPSSVCRIPVPDIDNDINIL